MEYAYVNFMWLLDYTGKLLICKGLSLIAFLFERHGAGCGRQFFRWL